MISTLVLFQKLPYSFFLSLSPSPSPQHAHTQLPLLIILQPILSPYIVQFQKEKCILLLTILASGFWLLQCIQGWERHCVCTLCASLGSAVFGMSQLGKLENKQVRENMPVGVVARVCLWVAHRTRQRW